MRNKVRERLLTHEEVEKQLKRCESEEKSTEVETMKYVVQTMVRKARAPAKLKEKLQALGVTEFEAVQLLNSPPKKVLDLYVIVEEVEERLTESEIAEIIFMLSPYAE